jgi:hypothetical protein
MNDPRITAYALGELTGKERDNFERDLADSNVLQAELNNIVSMTNDLGRLPKPSEGLTTEDRIALLRACHENQAEFQRNKKILRWFLPVGLAAAASVAILASFLYRPSAAELAMASQPEPSPLKAISESQTSSGEQVAPPHLESAVNAISSSSPSADSLAPNTNSGHEGSHTRAYSRTACHQEHKLVDQTVISPASPVLANQVFQPEKPGKGVPLQENQNKICNAKNGHLLVESKRDRISEYSLNIDVSNYAKIRDQILRGELPPKSAVHIEDLINAFSYNYSSNNGNPFLSTDIEVGKAPWNEKHLLVRIGIQSKQVAENVKAEILFNPTQAAYYRLIGYEGQGGTESEVAVTSKIEPPFSHTALYEVIPADQSQPQNAPKGFQRTETIVENQPVDTGDFLTLKIHHRSPESSRCQLLISRYNADSAKSFDDNTNDFRFAASVAAFGMKLRDSQETENMPWAKIERIASQGIGEDQDGQRADFASLVKKASRLQTRGISAAFTQAPVIAFGLIQ